MDDPDAGSSETVRKRAWLDEHYITIVRCHDVWDAIPDIGMPYAWGEYLGLGAPRESEHYYNVYDIEPQPASTFAARIASRTSELEISVDDVVRAWIDGEKSADSGYPLIIVNHCVSE